MKKYTVPIKLIYTFIAIVINITAMTYMPKGLAGGNYKCDWPGCNKSYKWSQSLADHKHVHLGTYTCLFDNCGKRFESSHKLTVHKRSHTGIKPFACQICNQPFISKRYLNRHMQSHNKSKPYSCTLCNKLFSSSSNAYRHLQKGICDLSTKGLTSQQLKQYVKYTKRGTSSNLAPTRNPNLQFPQPLSNSNNLLNVIQNVNPTQFNNLISNGLVNSNTIVKIVKSSRDLPSIDILKSSGLVKPNEKTTVLYLSKPKVSIPKTIPINVSDNTNNSNDYCQYHPPQGHVVIENGLVVPLSLAQRMGLLTGGYNYQLPGGGNPGDFDDNNYPGGRPPGWGGGPGLGPLGRGPGPGIH